MDEYLARLGLDVGEFLAAANAIQSAIGRIEASGVTLTRDFANLDNALAKVTSSMSAEGAAAGTLAKQLDAAAASSKAMEASQARLAQSQVAAALEREGSAFAQLTRDVREAEKAYREFRQGQVTGEGGGTGIAAYSRADLQTLLATRAAANPSLLNTAASMEREANGAGYANAATNSDAQIALETAARQRASALVKATFLDQEGAELASNTRALAATEAILGRKVDIYEESDRKILASEAERIAKGDAAQAASDAGGAGSLSLPRIRYGLYDVSNATALASASTLVLGAGIVAVAADYEQLFSQVQRTSDVRCTCENSCS